MSAPAASLSRGPITHFLKTHPEPFGDVRQGIKTAELRIDDRDFRPGDTMVLKEWKPKSERFTGREIRTRITHITRLYRWIPNVDSCWVMLSFETVIE